MDPPLSTSTQQQQQQHRPDDSFSPNSTSSPPRVLKKRFTLRKSTGTSSCDAGHDLSGGSTGAGGGTMLKRHSNKSRIMATGDALSNEEQQQNTNHSTNGGSGGGIWKSFSSALTHPTSSHAHSQNDDTDDFLQQYHPWAFQFKEEGLPHYLHGKSIQGHAVLYIKLHKNKLPDLFKKGCTIDQVEAYFRLMLDFLSRRCCGTRDDDNGGFVVVVDMKHSKMKHLTGEETTQALKKLEKLCKSPQYPPQMIQRVILIHAPLWLTSAWPGLKVLVPDAIPIHVVNSTKTHKKLLKYIPQNELPTEFGGNEHSNLGDHDSDKELYTLLTKLGSVGGGDKTTTTATVAAAPPQAANASDLSSRPSTTRVGGDESIKTKSGGGVVASARSLLTVSLRFHHREEEEEQDNVGLPQQAQRGGGDSEEGVETVVKIPNKSSKKGFLFAKLIPRRKSSVAGSTSSKTCTSSFSTLEDGDKKQHMSMDDSEEEEEEDSSGVVDHDNDEVVETAGVISSSYNDNNQDASIWVHFFKWLSPEKTSPCPPHKTTVYYSSTVENIVPVPLVGVVPTSPPQSKTSRTRKQHGLPKRRSLQDERLQHKSVFGRGQRRSTLQ